jgi:mannose-6-phosphate isomerase
VPELFKLRNQIQYYEWGSPEWIPRLTGIANNEGRPCAEMWMGSHPASPSLAVLPGGVQDLGTLIAGNPRRYLGARTPAQYGALPFLFKLLAAEQPLSIQAHPDLERAAEGFERENRAGLAASAPGRNYRDPNHKPEIICALAPFTGMCGFREPDEIRRLLEAFVSPPGSPAAPAVLRNGFVPLLAALDDADTSSALRNFFAALFSMSAAVRMELAPYMLSASAAVDGELTDTQWNLMRRFAGLYPNDPALIAPLYLNIFSLDPGEAVYLRTGILHAYIHGFGVELMANSDNVLRGGLTSKHVDSAELMKVLDFSPLRPEIIRPDLRPAEEGPSRFTYQTPCNEFSLTVMRGGGQGAAAFIEEGPAICIVTAGEVEISGRDGVTVLKQGESAFISPSSAAEQPLWFRGNYTLYAAAAL